MKMEIVTNERDWRKRLLNVGETPRMPKFPVLMWLETCGGGIGGEFEASQWIEIPQNYDKTQQKAFRKGVREGLRYGRFS